MIRGSDMGGPSGPSRGSLGDPARPRSRRPLGALLRRRRRPAADESPLAWSPLRGCRGGPRRYRAGRGAAALGLRRSRRPQKSAGARGVWAVACARGGEADLRPCIPLEELRNGDVPKVGGKSASLGEMIGVLADVGAPCQGTSPGRPRRTGTSSSREAQAKGSTGPSRTRASTPTRPSCRR
ncbi:unnamed protein product [Prorocentrum cordatum]|uniref:Uncharacterized protein n=1 Tax=Prorocentrum cordatum TaxID=2364126 RepID=A0ABN9RT82_9DINO|nr:unnamed protein product [Polarella glacialis]